MMFLGHLHSAFGDTLHDSSLLSISHRMIVSALEIDNMNRVAFWFDWNRIRTYSTFDQVAGKAAFQFPQPNTKCTWSSRCSSLKLYYCLVQVLLKVKSLVLVLFKLLYQICNVIITCLEL